jgi:hypothetical protein
VIMADAGCSFFGSSSGRIGSTTEVRRGLRRDWSASKERFIIPALIRKGFEKICGFGLHPQFSASERVSAAGLAGGVEVRRGFVNIRSFRYSNAGLLLCGDDPVPARFGWIAESSPSSRTSSPRQIKMLAGTGERSWETIFAADRILPNISISRKHHRKPTRLAPATGHDRKRHPYPKPCRAFRPRDLRARSLPRCPRDHGAYLRALTSPARRCSSSSSASLWVC